MSDADPDALGPGTWVELDPEEPLADRSDLVLAIARRRDVEPGTVAAELAAIGDRFDVDAVYLAAAEEE